VDLCIEISEESVPGKAKAGSDAGGSLGELNTSVSSMERPRSWEARQRMMSPRNVSPTWPTSPMPLFSRERREELRGRIRTVGRERGFIVS